MTDDSPEPSQPGAMMPAETAQAMVRCAVAGMPLEVCGFVMLDWGLVPIENVHPMPKTAFAMEPEEQKYWMLNHMADIRGVYHSHPSGRNELSPEDLVAQKMYPMFRFWLVTAMNVYEWTTTHNGQYSVPARRTGAPGTPGLAYPVLAPTAEV